MYMLTTPINKDGSADVNLELTVENTDDKVRDIIFLATLEGKNFDVKEMKLEFKQTLKSGLKLPELG